MRNPLRADPTRTTLLRKQFLADITRRLKSVVREAERLIVEDDVFGLKKIKPKSIKTLAYQEFRFLSNPAKIEAFRKWLKSQVDAKLLVVESHTDKPWLAKYIESSYKKGLIRAYTQVHSESLADVEDFYIGGRTQFLADAFAAPVVMEQVKLLYTRAFTELKGITDTMDQQISRILADGFTKGESPQTIARNLRKSVAGITKRRATVLARTEIIRAHAEGQLTGFEQLGVTGVKIQAEWLTAGDGRVCPLCSARSGEKMTIEQARGLIPLHPNCRCAWLGVVE